MDHSGPKNALLQKSIKQRKLGLLKQQQQQQQQQQSTPTNPTISKKGIPGDDIKDLQQLTQELLFEKAVITAPDSKRVTERSLPPLTSSNELDVRLYALFALLLHNFVFGWYSKSLNLGSREEFTKELVFLFAHITRNFQERINTANDEFVRLIITDIPYLLESHFESIQDLTCVLARDGFEDSDEVESNKIFVDEWMMRNSDGLVDDEKLSVYRRLLVKSVICLILPPENVESSISREFIVSLLDGIVLKNVIESFCDSFVIWDIIGKLCSSLTSPSKKSAKCDPLVRRKSSLHRVLEFFVIDEKYEVKAENMLGFVDFIPFFTFVNILTHFGLRFPILVTFVQVVFQLMLKVNYLRRFVNSSVKRVISEKVMKRANAEKLVDSLRHMMFPENDQFHMKPRYVPQSRDELKAVHDDNMAQLVKFLSCNSTLSRMFVSRHESHTPTIVNSKAELTMQMFKHRQINKILLQRLIDLTIARIFPEMQVQDTVSMYQIHR